MNRAQGTPELYDIYGMWHIPFWQTRILWGSLIVLLVIFLISLLAYFFIHYRRRKRTETAWDKALHALRLLKIEDSISKEESKQFYFVLTAIIKTYVQERYDLAVKGKTDCELLLILEKSTFPPELLHYMRDIFTGCLQIKYADEQALQDQVKRDFDNALMIVKLTSLPDKGK